MIAEQRRERILREIVMRGRLEVADFARRTELSGMTIRRDLAVLAERSADGAPTALRVDSVRSDHGFGAELAVDHLAERGHRGVGLLLRETATAPWVADGHARATRRHGMVDAPVATTPSPRWGDGST